MSATAEVLKELRRINERLDELAAKPAEPIIYTRREAARELRISMAQLYRLIAAGRLTALPSGIAREELLRYARTPQTKLRSNATRGKREFRASAEADKLDAILKRQRRPRGVI